MVTTASSENVCDDLIDEAEDETLEKEIESEYCGRVIDVALFSGVSQRSDIDIIKELCPLKHVDADRVQAMWDEAWDDWDAHLADTSILDGFAMIDQVFQNLRQKGILALHAHELRGKDSLFAMAYDLGQQLGRGIHAYCYYHGRDAVAAGFTGAISLKFGALYGTYEVDRMVGELLKREFAAAGITVTDADDPDFNSVRDRNSPNENQLILAGPNFARRPLPMR